MNDLKCGDEVEVLDEGLAMLRRRCPGQPPNHHGRVSEIHDNLIFVEFPIDGSYEHSQCSPYMREQVRLRTDGDK